LKIETLASCPSCIRGDRRLYVEYSTSSRRGGATAKNTEGQTGEAKVRAIMINLRGGGYKVKGIMGVHN